MFWSVVACLRKVRCFLVLSGALAISAACMTGGREGPMAPKRPVADVASFAMADAAESVELFAVSRRTMRLYRIVPDPLSATEVGPVHPSPGNADLTELIAIGNGNAYTVDRRGNRLLTIRLDDAALLNAVKLDQNVFVTRRGFDIAPDGLLWGVLPGMELRTINPFSGRSMFMAPITGAEVVEAIAFSPDGTLYAVGAESGRASHQLFTIDMSTGGARLIASLPVRDVDALTWAADGYLYGADSRGSAADLYRIDPVSGELTNLGSTGIVELNGLTAAR